MSGLDGTGGVGGASGPGGAGGAGGGSGGAGGTLAQGQDRRRAPGQAKTEGEGEATAQGQPQQHGRLGGLLARLGGDGALPLISAGVAGSLMAVQGTFNSVLSKFIGLLETSFLVQLLGAVAAAILLFGFSLGRGTLGAIGQAPWYTLLGGPIGLAIVYFVAFGIARAGVANATTAIIIGQVGTALLIDSLGLFGAEPVAFRWTKLIGVVLLAVAGWLMLRR